MYSIDLKERVVSAIKKGMGKTEAAEIFNVGRRTIYEWLDLLKNNKSLAPKSGYQKGRTPTIKDWDQFKAFVEKHTHCTSPQMIIEWKKLTGVNVATSVMLRALHKINFSPKKKRFIMPRQTNKNASCT